MVALDEGHEAELRGMARNAAEEAKIRLLRSYDPRADAADLEVPDPYYGGSTGFDLCLSLVEAAVPGLLDEVTRRLDEAAGAAPDERLGSAY